MGYPGDEWPPSPYGERPANTPPGQYGGGDPYGPGASDAPGGHDPYRGYPPLNDPQGPPPDQADTRFFGDAPAYGGSGRQPPYGASATGPYGPPQPYTEPPPYGGYGPSGPQMPAGPGGWQGPPGGYGGPPGNGPGGGKGKMMLIIGGVVAVVILLGGGGTALAFAMKKDDPPKPQPTRTEAQPTPTRSPTEASPTPTDTGAKPSSGRWLKLASRSTDPHAITLSEMFGKSRLSGHGRSYRLVTRQETKSCESVMTGGKLRAALTAGNCTQVLRATYLRGDGKLMGTVSISNLDDYSGVRTAFLAAKGGQQYVDPLRGSGRTAKLGRGAALGIRQVKGHYLILSWVQYSNGQRPSDAGRKQLSAFHDDVVSAALARPLGYRMITGRPQK
jgi:hypothetical protein